jgi:hypothetical protein
MKTELRPLTHLQSLSRAYPSAWKMADRFRADRGKDLPKWPAWCFMPMAGWYAIVSERHNIDRLGLDLIGNVSALSAIGPWRYSQGIYRFDPDMLATLTDTIVSGDIPVEVLFRLPEWSLYIETPGMTFCGVPLYGYFTHLEWDTNTERQELRLLLDTDIGFIPLPVHIGKWTITEAVDRVEDEAVKNAVVLGVAYEKDMEVVQVRASEINPLISLLLYICSEEPEIDDEREPGASPSRPQPKKTKHGWRLFPPKRPRIWTAGKATGQRLREATEVDETGKAIRPHLRRGHWHGFWTGPKTEKQKFVYKWLAPMMVGGTND